MNLLNQELSNVIEKKVIEAVGETKYQTLVLISKQAHVPAKVIERIIKAEESVPLYEIMLLAQYFNIDLSAYNLPNNLSKLTVQERIVYFRRKNGMTIKEFCKYTGIDQNNTYHTYISGKSNISKQRMLIISEALNISPNVLDEHFNFSNWSINDFIKYYSLKYKIPCTEIRQQIGATYSLLYSPKFTQEQFELVKRLGNIFKDTRILERFPESSIVTDTRKRRKTGIEYKKTTKKKSTINSEETNTDELIQYYYNLSKLKMREYVEKYKVAADDFSLFRKNGFSKRTLPWINAICTECQIPFSTFKITLTLNHIIYYYSVKYKVRTNDVLIHFLINRETYNLIQKDQYTELETKKIARIVSYRISQKYRKESKKDFILEKWLEEHPAITTEKFSTVAITSPINRIKNLLWEQKYKESEFAKKAKIDTRTFKGILEDESNLTNTYQLIIADSLGVAVNDINPNFDYGSITLHEYICFLLKKKNMLKKELTEKLGYNFKDFDDAKSLLPREEKVKVIADYLSEPFLIEVLHKKVMKLPLKDKVYYFRYNLRMTAPYIAKQYGISERQVYSTETGEIVSIMYLRLLCELYQMPFSIFNYSLSLGEAIKYYRKKHNQTQKDFCIKNGIHIHYLSLIDNEQEVPQFQYEKIYNIAYELIQKEKDSDIILKAWYDEQRDNENKAG